MYDVLLRGSGSTGGYVAFAEALLELRRAAVLGLERLLVFLKQQLGMLEEGGK